MTMRAIMIWLNLLSVGCLVTSDPHWSYTNSQTNPTKWAEINPVMCSGLFQSPVALDSQEATYLGIDSKANVDISQHSSQKSVTFNATNNGHSLQVEIPEETWKVTLNDNATDYYNVQQFHFHWGSVDGKGSEHTMDGNTFPLEMHIVSYSSMYADFPTAQSAPGGLSVIGVFFQLTTDQSKSSLSQMGNLLSELGQLINAGSHAQVQSFDPNVLLPANKNEFFRYFGSLTTPPCTENVQWTVMRNPLYVTPNDLQKLRSLLFGQSDENKPMQDNFRPVQPLSALQVPQPRVLYKSWSTASRPIANSLFAVCLLLTLPRIYV
ncbi:unnamed protein product [Schistocephalus solidus]|uniref:Carbonic anhydrase n=1 Tax=Schistocephalus solidus TaxID=70667 RepID=A0A3P7CRF5_SCHSO|nr:unnamed protein product [Schistocephalus solidus]